jgi:signal transduction histidine kinase/ActR/RegA family two-component response regulator
MTSRWQAPLVAAAVIFVVGQAGTIMLARNAGEQAAARQHSEFDNQVDDAIEVIEERLLAATVAIRALEGLFAADSEVDRREFHEFASALLENVSVRNLSFVKMVPTDEVEEVEDAVRSDTSLVPDGYPEFEVQPETTHPEVFVPIYIEPLVEGNPAFGFDLGTNPARRAALEKARDTGRLVATEGIDLVSDSAKGFLLMLPVYQGETPPDSMQQRVRQFGGVVQGVIAIDALVADLPGVGGHIELELHESPEFETAPEESSLLYRSSPSSTEEALTARRGLTVADRTWTVIAWQEATGFTAFTSIPTVITFAGTLLTLALAITAFTLVDGRERAFARARLLTGELREQAEHLRKARDRAIEADRLKTAFLANMSHELRTPLTAVIGLSSVLLKDTFGQLEQKQREYVEMISGSGAHLLDIVDDMLDLARIEAGREDLILEDIDLSRVIDEAMGMVAPHAAAKGVKLSRPELVEPLPVTADRRRIQQVLLNLMSNAVKFTDRGGEAGVSVKTGGGEVVIRVWDTGVGIPPDHIGRVFAPFHQVDSSLTRSRAGAGLGLALAQRLAEMHRGTLKVASTVGEGTEFTLTLPLLGGTHRPESPEKASISRIGLDGARVLVAEDNGVNRVLMTDLLRLAGCEVLEATDGAEALALARSEVPDLLVLDIMLPERDGISVARLLKSEPKTRHIKIIAVTALAMPEEQDLIREAGCDSYLAKPFTHDQYLRAVSDVLMSTRSVSR